MTALVKFYMTYDLSCLSFSTNEQNNRRKNN